jgi:hypothetical protein
MRSAAWTFVQGLGLLILLGCGGTDGGGAGGGGQAAAGGAQSGSQGSSAAPTAAEATPANGAATAGGEFDWVQSRADRPFAVNEFLNERARASDDRRGELYRQGLGLLSRDVGGAIAADLDRRIGEASDLDKLLAGGVGDDAIARIVADSRAAIGLIDQAQATPLSTPRRAVFMFDLRTDGLMPEAQAARVLARLAMIELYHARKTNDVGSACKAVERALAMSRDLQPRGPIVCQLVSMAMDGSISNATSRLLLDHPSLTIADCDRLLAILQAHLAASLPRPNEGIKVDYLVLMNTLAAVQAGKLDAKTAIELSGSGLPESLRIEKLDFESEYAAIGKLMGFALQDAGDPYWQLPAKGRFESEMDRASKLVESEAKKGNRQVPLATVLMAPAVGATLKAEARTMTCLNGLLCLLAVRRYELAHGALPSNLEAATSEAGLSEVPQDLYRGGPMLYRLNGNAALVYSVGEDRRDDEGRSDWNFGTQNGDFLFPLPPLPPGARNNGAETRPSPATSAESPKAEAPRTWTSTVGTKIEATFVSSDEKEVVLKKTDGTELRVPLEKLSEADRAWVTERK